MVQSWLRVSEDGCPAVVTTSRTLVHASTDATMIDTLYVYAVPLGEGITDLVLSECDADTCTVVSRQRLKKPALSLVGVLTGHTQTQGTNLYANTEGGNVLLMGYCEQTPLGRSHPSATLVTKQLILGHQLIDIVDSRPVQIDSRVPLSLVHLHHPGVCRLFIAQGPTGASKQIILAGKTAAHAICEIKLSQGNVQLTQIGDCISLISIGVGWLFLRHH